MNRDNHAVFNAEMSQLNDMMSWVRKCLISIKDSRKIELALEEVLVNIITHAYQNVKGTIDLTYRAIPNQSIEFVIKDWGIPFNPLLQIKTPDYSAPLEDREEGGLGIHLMRHYMDHLCYEHTSGANILTLTKNIS